jgi:hypothetical protein
MNTLSHSLLRLVRPSRSVLGPQSKTLVPGCLAGLVASLLLLSGCHKPEGTETPASAKASADSAPAAIHDTDAADGVSLKPEEVEKMGIEVTAATSSQHVPEVVGFGTVTAHEAIAQAAADLASAAAVERQSHAALARTQRLAGTPGAMGADALESAERQAAVDRAALLLVKQRLTANFGQKPPWKDDLDSPALRTLASGDTKLVRITFPLGSVNGDTPASVRMAHINEATTGRGWSSTTLWPAPADSSIPGRSFFTLLKGSDAGEGERLFVWAPVGTSESGVVVPASAAVISDGKFWCYVEHKPNVFTRVELDTSAPVADGYFVKDGVAPGDKVVTMAAGQLLARETNPSTAADE